MSFLITICFCFGTQTFSTDETYDKKQRRTHFIWHRWSSKTLRHFTKLKWKEKTKSSNMSQVYLHLSFITLAVSPVCPLLLLHLLSHHSYYSCWTHDLRTPHIQSQSAFFFQTLLFSIHATYYTSLGTFLKHIICYIVFPAPPLQRSLSILCALYPANLICHYISAGGTYNIINKEQWKNQTITD